MTSYHESYKILLLKEITLLICEIEKLKACPERRKLKRQLKKAYQNLGKFIHFEVLELNHIKEHKKLMETVPETLYK